MGKVDKSIVLTDSIVDELLDDWLVRDGDTYLKIRKKGRIGWEKTLEEGESYSAYILEAPTQEDLIKRAYTLAKETIVVMDPPFKVNIQITTNEGGGSFTDGKTVCVNTAMFDDAELSVGEKLDTFLGVTVHEGCHLLYSNFEELKKITIKVISVIFNVIEDERVEELCADNKPGLANFLEKSKYYYFDHYYLDYIVPKEKDGKLTPFDRLFGCFMKIIRYPKYLKEEEIIEFGHYLLAIKKIILPYPITTEDAVKAAYRVFDIIKEFYEDVEKERSESEGEHESDEEIRSKSEKRLADDVEDAYSALVKVVGRPRSEYTSDGGGKGLSKADLAEEVYKDGEILGEVCEGRVELGSSENSFFFKASENQSIYMESLKRVNRYIPAISKVLKGHCKGYKLIHRSMRSGVLDTNKLAEAFQGVSTVYLREGEVKTDKVAVCVLIDESGSMGGSRISAARDTAVLINEAIGQVPNVELFIYGHSGDEKRPYSTEIYVYREKGYTPRFSLGTVSARYQNRDGVAIFETAKRVRQQTDNPVLFFILSDGAPCAGGYGGISAMNHVKECVGKVERLGFNVIQVCINHSYDPQKMFRHYVIMEDMSKLSIELSKAIKKSAMESAKIRVS